MKKIIMDRLGCTAEMAERVEKNLNNISVELRCFVDKWLESGIVEDTPVYHGYSVVRLMEQYGMVFTGAILTLDWIIKDPDLALKALKEGIR